MRENWYRMVSSGHFEIFVSLLFLALTGKCCVLNTVLVFSNQAWLRKCYDKRWNYL